MEPKKDLKDLQGLKSTENIQPETAENPSSTQEEKNSTDFSLKEESRPVDDGNQPENFSDGKGKDFTGEGDASLSAKHSDEAETPSVSPEGGKSGKDDTPETAGGKAPDKDGKEDGEADASGMTDGKTGEEEGSEQPVPPEAPEDKMKEEQDTPEKEEKDVSGKAPTEKEETDAPGAKASGETESETAGEEKVEEKQPEKASSASKETPSRPKKEKKVASSKKPDKPDYSKYNQVELVNAMRNVLEHDGHHNIKDDVETIKAAFYKNLKEETEQQKKEFLEAGGSEEDFNPEENPYEKDIKNLLKKYRHLRSEYNKKLEEEKEINLQLKYQVIEEIKGLINKEESINKTFQEFIKTKYKISHICAKRKIIIRNSIP